MYCKITKSYRDVVALCDKELLGKIFFEKKFQLDVKESFYKGELVSHEQALALIEEMMAEDATFNIVGERAVQTAKEAGLIDDKAVGSIAGIPFALVLI